MAAGRRIDDVPVWRSYHVEFPLRHSDLSGGFLPHGRCGLVIKCQIRYNDVRRTDWTLNFLRETEIEAPIGMTAETTARKQRGRPFPKGRSGNPAGRPPGARNAATILAEQLLDGEAEPLIRKAIEKAKKGDMAALRLCLDRILPPRRERPVHFKLPELASAADATRAMSAITTGVAHGELTPAEAADLSRSVESYVRAIEASEIERRLKALEERQFTGSSE